MTMLRLSSWYSSQGATVLPQTHLLPSSHEHTPHAQLDEIPETNRGVAVQALLGKLAIRQAQPIRTTIATLGAVLR